MTKDSKKQVDPKLPVGALWAKDINPIFHPDENAPKTHVEDDGIGLKWTIKTAFEQDVRNVQESSQHSVLLPKNKEQGKYPHFTTMNGLVYKTHIPGVLTSYEDIMRYGAPHISDDSIILDGGVGTGLMALTLLQNTKSTVVISDYGSTGILALINLARAGYEVLVIPEDTEVSDLKELSNHLRIKYNCRVIYTPLDFDAVPPRWLRVDFITCDHSIVYTPRKNRFEQRIRNILHSLNSGGHMLITQLNHNAPADVFEKQKKKEGNRIKKAAFSFKFGRLFSMIKALKEASKIKELLQEMQLHTDELREVLKKFGDFEVHEIQDGLNLAYIFTPR